MADMPIISREEAETRMCECGHSLSYHLTPGAECTKQLMPDACWCGHEPPCGAKCPENQFCQCSMFKEVIHV